MGVLTRRKLRLLCLAPFLICFGIYVFFSSGLVYSQSGDCEMTFTQGIKNFSTVFLERLPSPITSSSQGEHESLVMRSKNNLVELGYTVQKILVSLKTNSPQNANEIDEFQTLFNNQLHAALIDVEDLSNLNEEWRKKEASDLQNLVQQRLNYLQNPKNCGAAKVLICKPLTSCGFACSIHHLSYCFMVAYQLERTLVIENVMWEYQEKFSDLFLPISSTCLKATKKGILWAGEKHSKLHQVVYFSIVNGMVAKRPQTGLPADLAPRLLRLHGNPLAWWNGQFLKYLMAPLPSLENEINQRSKSLDFQIPCVGIHVRRTDKVGTEAAFHSIEEYMKHAIAWYDKLDLRLSKEKHPKKAIRRIYLASDDPSVLPEAKRKFPNYIFYPESNSSKSSSGKERYEKNGLKHFLVDLNMLTKCDYLVCTFSSGVCRVAYELLQTLHPNAYDFFHSLDDDYWYIGQTAREEEAVIPHEGGEKELSFEVGDVIGIAGNHWDGQSKGTRKKTMKVGLYPSHKLKKIYQIVETPLYSDALNCTIGR